MDSASKNEARLEIFLLNLIAMAVRRLARDAGEAPLTSSTNNLATGFEALTLSKSVKTSIRRKSRPGAVKALKSIDPKWMVHRGEEMARVWPRGARHDASALG